MGKIELELDFDHFLTIEETIEMTPDGGVHDYVDVVIVKFLGVEVERYREESYETATFNRRETEERVEKAVKLLWKMAGEVDD